MHCICAVKASGYYMFKRAKDIFEDKWSGDLVFHPYYRLTLTVTVFPWPSEQLIYISPSLHFFALVDINDLKGICLTHCSRECWLPIFSAIRNTKSCFFTLVSSTRCQYKAFKYSALQKRLSDTWFPELGRG